MTTPQPQDDSYPSAWTPRHIAERDRALEMPEVEVFLTSLTDQEYSALTQRVRKDR